jgi:hypothetical protein
MYRWVRCDAANKLCAARHRCAAFGPYPEPGLFRVVQESEATKHGNAMLFDQRLSQSGLSYRRRWHLRSEH